MGVRFRVFVGEQSVPAEEELDEYDAVATARIGRMAVDSEWRRQGIGGRLLSFLEDEARSLGVTNLVLNAQEYVKSFYAAHGYEEQGDVFLEANILHISMHKQG